MMYSRYRPDSGPELSLKLGTYKPTGLCDIAGIGKVGLAYYICSMARRMGDTQNRTIAGCGASPAAASCTALHARAA